MCWPLAKYQHKINSLHSHTVLHFSALFPCQAMLYSILYIPTSRNWVMNEVPAPIANPFKSPTYGSTNPWSTSLWFTTRCSPTIWCSTLIFTLNLTRSLDERQSNIGYCLSLAVLVGTASIKLYKFTLRQNSTLSFILPEYWLQVHLWVNSISATNYISQYTQSQSRSV